MEISMEIAPFQPCIQDGLTSLGNETHMLKSDWGAESHVWFSLQGLGLVIVCIACGQQLKE